MKFTGIKKKTRMQTGRTLAMVPPDVPAQRAQAENDFRSAEDLATQVVTLEKKVDELEARRPKGISDDMWELLKTLKR